MPFIHFGDDVESSNSCNNESASCTKQKIPVSGGPDTGKSFCIHHIIEYALEYNAKVAIACPTGFLPSCYKATVSEGVECDTVYTMFHVPVGDGRPAVNWALSLFDIIILDKVSQVSLCIMEHVIHSVDMLPKSTLLICVGDKYQTQPRVTVNG